MPTDINRDIEHKIQSFVSELSNLVRKAALEAVGTALSGGAAAARPRVSVATPSAHSPAAKPAAPIAKAGKRAKGRRIRRSPEQIAAAVDKVYGYIKANPNQRSEKIRQTLNMDRATIRDALDRLMSEKRLKIKGVRRAATYTVS